MYDLHVLVHLSSTTFLVTYLEEGFIYCIVIALQRADLMEGLNSTALYKIPVAFIYPPVDVCFQIIGT